MKRHHALEPFSRDHFSGLVVAKHLQERPNTDSVSELLLLWKNEMEDHFREEERLFAELAPAEMASRLMQDHREIEAMVRQASEGSLTDGEIVRLGKLINDHIRWEERQLFPALEQLSEIDSIWASSMEMEKRRQEDGHHQRRAELVNRRTQENQE